MGIHSILISSYCTFLPATQSTVCIDLPQSEKVYIGCDLLESMG